MLRRTMIPMPLLVLALAACSTNHASRTAATMTVPLSNSFNSNCTSCHGDAGAGSYGPAVLKTKLTLAEFRDTVRSGIGRMPGFPSTAYSDADIAADYAILTAM
jgi:mono/diheme cytochrome c family protein